MRSHLFRVALGLTVGALVAGCSASSSGSATRTPSSPASSVSTTPTASSARATTTENAAPSTASAIPRFDHVVVVVEENHSSGEVIGNSSAPFTNSLARTGALLTQSYGLTHPSYPNYLALFSGSTHGMTEDSCPHYFSSNNLAAQARARGVSFVGYAQSLPSSGYRGCSAGPYARRHAPWVDFTNIPRSLSRPMTAFPSDLATLPRLAFVVPDLNYDMHDGTIAQADSWLRSNLGRYASWARTHRSLLIVTWDEDDRSAGNHVPTILVGASVRAGKYATRVDHYRVLRTIEASFGLAPLGVAAQRTPITGIWTS